MKRLILFLFFASMAAGFADKPKEWTVVLDPGHGGPLVMGVNDGSGRSHGASHNNAVGHAHGAKILEKDLTLLYSKSIAAEINKLPDARAVLTRESDVSVSAMGRAATAVENQADVFLSIHFNGGGGNGTRTYVVSEDHMRWEYMHFINPYIKRDAALGLKLALAIDKVFAPYGGKPSGTKVYNDSKYPNDTHGLGLGDFKDGIRTLGYARMDPHLYNAAVLLVEVEFLDSPKNATRLVNYKVRTETARAIAKALQEWRTGESQEFLVKRPLKAFGR